MHSRSSESVNLPDDRQYLSVGARVLDGKQGALCLAQSGFTSRAVWL